MQPAEIISRPADEVEGVTHMERNQAAIDLLNSWRQEGDIDEQRETGTYLLRVLIEDRIVIGRDQHGDRA